MALILGLLLLVNFVTNKEIGTSHYYINTGEGKWIEIEVTSEIGDTISPNDVVNAISNTLIGVEDSFTFSDGSRHEHLNVIKTVKLTLPKQLLLV